MKVMVLSPIQRQTSGRLGPMCIACSNTQRFWVHTPDGEELMEYSQLPEGEVQVVACGRCRSQHSLVIAHID